MNEDTKIDGYRLKGVNDDHDTCSLCGKTNLKKVMWIAPLVDGEEVSEPDPYGTTCGFKVLGRGNGRRVSSGKAAGMVHSLAIEELGRVWERCFGRMTLIRGQYGGGFYLPRMTAIEFKAGRIDRKEANRQRRELFPVAAYYDGTKDARRSVEMATEILADCEETLRRFAEWDAR